MHTRIVYRVYLAWLVLCMCPGRTTWNETTCVGASLEETCSPSLSSHWPPVAFHLHGWDHVKVHLCASACQLVLSLLTLGLVQANLLLRLMDAFSLLCLGGTIYQRCLGHLILTVFPSSMIYHKP